MKRSVVAALALVLAPGLAACGSGSPTASPSGTTTSGASAGTPTTTTTTTATGYPSGSLSAGATTTAITPGTTSTCQPVTEAEIAALFQRWNDDVKSGDPDRVVENYAADSILVPTVSNQVRTTAAAKRDYFVHFLANKPSGVINVSDITLGCNMAVDSGLYTFTYGASGRVVPARYSFTYRWEGGQWLISSHHSSAMPEPAGAPGGPGTAAPTASTGSAH